MSARMLFECETFGSPFLLASAVVPRAKKMLPPSVAVSKLKMTGALFTTELNVPAIHSREETLNEPLVRCSLRVDKAVAAIRLAGR